MIRGSSLAYFIFKCSGNSCASAHLSAFSNSAFNEASSEASDSSSSVECVGMEFGSSCAANVESEFMAESFLIHPHLVKSRPTLRRRGFKPDAVAAPRQSNDGNRRLRQSVNKSSDCVASGECIINKHDR